MQTRNPNTEVTIKLNHEQLEAMNLAFNHSTTGYLFAGFMRGHKLLVKVQKEIGEQISAQGGPPSTKSESLREEAVDHQTKGS